MEMSIDDLMRLQDKATAEAMQKQKMQDEMDRLREALARAEENARRLEERALQAEQLVTTKDMENFYLKTYIALSREKVRQFFKCLKDIQATALIHTFLVKVLPDGASLEQRLSVDEVTGMPQNKPDVQIDVKAGGINIQDLGNLQL